VDNRVCGLFCLVNVTARKFEKSGDFTNFLSIFYPLLALLNVHFINSKKGIPTIIKEIMFRFISKGKMLTVNF